MLSKYESKHERVKQRRGKGRDEPRLQEIHKMVLREAKEGDAKFCLPLALSRGHVRPMHQQKSSNLYTLLLFIDFPALLCGLQSPARMTRRSLDAMYIVSMEMCNGGSEQLGRTT